MFQEEVIVRPVDHKDRVRFAESSQVIEVGVRLILDQFLLWRREKDNRTVFSLFGEPIASGFVFMQWFFFDREKRERSRKNQERNNLVHKPLSQRFSVLWSR